MARVRDMRGGRDNDADFGTRMTGQGVWAQLLRQRFEKACARLGLNRRSASNSTCAQFAPASARRTRVGQRSRAGACRPERRADST